MSKFDLRRASKEQLDLMNADIQNYKSGKKYTIHQSGGLDFILAEETGVDPEVTPEPDTHVQKISRCVEFEARFEETHGERDETHLEFNFGDL